MSTYNNNIQFSDNDTLISKMENKNIDCSDHYYTDILLNYISYSSITKGFKNKILVNEDKQFKNRITTKELYYFYLLNNDISTLLLKNILHIELFLNTSLSKIIGENFGTDTTPDEGDINNPTDYLYFDNYIRNDNSMVVLTKLKQHITNPIAESSLHYYTNNKNYIPPWVLLNSVYLSNTIGLFQILKSDHKTIIRNSFLFRDDLEITNEILSDSLIVLSKFRNKLAHPNIILKTNYINKIPLKNIAEYSNFTLVKSYSNNKNKTTKNSSIFSLVLAICILLPTNELLEIFKKELEDILHKYDSLILNYETFKVLSLPNNMINRIDSFINYKQNYLLEKLNIIT